MIQLIEFLIVLLLPFLIFKINDIFKPEFFINAYFVIFIGLGPFALYIVSPVIYETSNYAMVTDLLMISYACMNAGFGLCIIFQDKKKKYLINNSSQNYLFPVGYYKLAGKMLIFISIFSIAIYFQRAGTIPIFEIDKEAARVAALQVAGNGYFLYLATLGMLGVLIISTIDYRSAVVNKYNIRKIDIYIFFISLFVGAILLGTGSRRYMFWVILYAMIARNYFVDKIEIKYAIIIGLLAFLLINIFEMYRNDKSDTTIDISTTVYYRFIVYFYNLQAVFDAFKNSDSLYGETFIMDILTILPGKQIDYQSWLKEVTGMEFEGFGVPPTIAGDLYINFGTIGVIIFSFIFGFIIKQIYFNKINSIKSSVMSLPIYALTLDIGVKILTSGFSAQALAILWLTCVISTIHFINSIFSIRYK